jgi:ABC-type uncharacterized transport system involved in gliding motility auxiliary subunit
VALMKPNWRRFAPVGLYLALAAGLAAAGLYIVQREFNLYLQISLGLVLIGLAMFAILDPEKVRVALTGRQARYGSNALVMSLAFLGILAVINFLVFQNSKRWDLTENQQYTLAPETIDTLESLPAPVMATGFYTPALSNQNAQGLLDQYKFHSGGNFEYEFINPEEDQLAAREAGISRNGTVVLRLGENTEQLTLVSEQELTSALVRLINPGTRAVYFLTGHGEFELEGAEEGSYSQAKATLERKNYIVQPLNLLATNQIPEDAKVVVVAGPTQPLTQAEVDLLAAYQESGGSLVVMQEPSLLTDFGDTPDPLAAFLSETWGIEFGDDLVVDLTSGQPFLAVANQYAQHVITEKVQGLVSIYPTARSVLASPDSAFGLVSLVQTSDQSWAETDLEALRNSAQTGETPQIQPDEGVDQMGPVSLAVLGENTVQGSRLVVFGDSEFGSDAYFSQFGNGDMFVNTIDWASDQENLISLTPKENTPRLLVPPGPYTMNLILLGSVFLLPGLVLLAGVAVYIQRRRRG